MLAPTAIARDLVLVGGGHHALVLRMLAMRPVAGLRITLISPASHTPDSGMLPGLVARHYRFEQTHIDLARLCQWAGVRFIAGGHRPGPAGAAVVPGGPAGHRVRPGQHRYRLPAGAGPGAGARAHAVPVKPVAGLWQRWQDLLQRQLAALPPGTHQRIAVVGGGAGSVELALAMAHRLEHNPVDIELWCGAPEILRAITAGLAKASWRHWRATALRWNWMPGWCGWRQTGCCWPMAARPPSMNCSGVPARPRRAGSPPAACRWTNAAFSR